jgi:tetratricopeptide (TPR) repeat protein
MPVKEAPDQEDAIILARQGRLDEALSWYNRALVTSPKNDLYLTNKTVVLISLGRYEEALMTSRQAASVNPYSADIWINTGVALDNLGRHPEAIDALEQAVALSPYNAYARALLGIVYQKMEMDDKAQVQNRLLQEIVFPREYAGFYFATAVFLLGLLLGGIQSVEGKPPGVTAFSELMIILLFCALCGLYWRSLRLFQEINRDVLSGPGLLAGRDEHSLRRMYGPLGLLGAVFLAGIAAGILTWAHFS